MRNARVLRKVLDLGLLRLIRAACFGVTEIENRNSKSATTLTDVTFRTSFSYAAVVNCFFLIVDHDRFTFFFKVKID